MNTSLICLLAVFTSAPSDQDIDAVFGPVSNDVIIRAQTPAFEAAPDSGTTIVSPGETALPPQTTYYQQPMNQGIPYDPFMNGTPTNGTPFGVQDPYMMGGPQVGTYGAYGNQPYRFGWRSKYDFGWLAPADTERDMGDFSAFEFDAEWEYAYQKHCCWVEKITPQFGLRTFDGPTSGVITPTTALPGSVFRFGLDIEMATPANNPWSYQIGFTPSINSDLENSLSSNAWQFDGRGVIFYKPFPSLMYALGAAYWDRVDDYIIPLAGIVWNPDDIWEFRLVFPDPRVSVFLGNVWGAATWFYVRASYNVEAYEIKSRAGGREEVEFEDWRALLGFRRDYGWATTFYEAGWIFGRDVDYKNGTPGFNIDTGFIARAGIRF